MNEDSLDVFGRAMLYIYRARLENLGFQGDLRVVRVAEPEQSESEMTG